MGSNTVALLGLALQAMTQAQSYQNLVLRANAEGRDVTDEEVAAAKAEAQAAIDALAAS